MPPLSLLPLRCSFWLCAHGCSLAISSRGKTQVKTILCIDDYQPFLQRLAGVLEDEGYRSIVTSNPLRGVLIATTGRDVDLVVSDFVMPELSGAEVIQEIRRYRRYLPIVLLSGVERLPACGADRYLRKSAHWRSQLQQHLRQLLYGEAIDQSCNQTKRPNTDWRRHPIKRKLSA